MINRAPGLKIVLNALFAAIPDVLNVAAVCFMFFIIFAILGVNYFKGVLMSCQGEEFDALPEEITQFIEGPMAWNAMSGDQQSWFSPLSNVSSAFSVNSTGGFTTASACGAINSGWPGSGGCCTEWPSSAGGVPTSLQVRTYSRACGFYHAVCCKQNTKEASHDHGVHSFSTTSERQPRTASAKPRPQGFPKGTFTHSPKPARTNSLKPKRGMLCNLSQQYASLLNCARGILYTPATT